MVLRIAVDLDGVLADTMVTFCKILNQHHSTQFTVNSFIQWNAWRIAHIPKDEFFRTLDEAWFEWENIPAVDDHIGGPLGGYTNLVLTESSLMLKKFEAYPLSLSPGPWAHSDEWKFSIFPA